VTGQKGCDICGRRATKATAVRDMATGWDRTAQTGQDRIERTGRPGYASKDRTAGTGEMDTRVLEQYNWDRTAGTVEPGQDSGIEQPEKDSRDRTAGEDSHKDRTGWPVQDKRTGQWRHCSWRQQCWRRTAVTKQPGENSHRGQTG
jgi:hypothetical protein